MKPTSIPAQTGVGFQLRRGEDLRVTSPTGAQVADLFCFSQQRPCDALSSGRSIDYNETIRFTQGHILFSQAGIPLLQIVEDSCRLHDFLVAPCSLQMFQMLAQTNEYHPSCHENLCHAFTQYHLAVESISTTFNVFMHYEVDQKGNLHLRCPSNKQGDSVVFRACEDLIVGLTACADPATNGGCCKGIEYSITG